MEKIDNQKAQTRKTGNSEPMLEYLTTYAEASEKKGLYPYDGQWLSIDKINEQIRRKHFNSRIQMLELGSLFALVYVFAMLMWLIISRFTY
ncbi:MAG: hypothetical protein HKN34_08985 [Gammaproteobacteria bacterium]|nr:hypothetical protein [Gammaproteobacteria bacterium]